MVNNVGEKVLGSLFLIYVGKTECKHTVYK